MLLCNGGVNGRSLISNSIGLCELRLAFSVETADVLDQMTAKGKVCKVIYEDDGGVCRRYGRVTGSALENDKNETTSKLKRRRTVVDGHVILVTRKTESTQWKKTLTDRCEIGAGTGVWEWRDVQTGEGRTND